MRTGLVSIVLGALVLASPALAQGQERKIAVTGWPPYTFGADLATILQTNSTLRKGCVVNGQRAQMSTGWLCVQGKVDAPIAGRAYSADLFLLFNHDRLSAVLLMWTFDSPMSRREAGNALERELWANYAGELIRGIVSAPLEIRQLFGFFMGLQRPEDAIVYLTFWQDAQGNMVAIVDAWGQPTLLLMYVSAGVTPPPPAKY